MTKDKPAPAQRTKTADKTLKTPRTSGRGPALAAAPLQPIEPEIAEGADHRYLERNTDPGDEFTDWLKAERESKAARGIE